MTAPDVPALCDDLTALREAVAATVWEHEYGAVPWNELSPTTPTRTRFRETADAVLALPEFAALLAKVRRQQSAIDAVRELAKELEQFPDTTFSAWAIAERLRTELAAALSGEAHEDGGR